MEGLPYGKYNFLYGWVDTPNDNWPPLLPREAAPVLFKIYEDFNFENAYVFFTEGINKRLGVENKSISEVTAIAA